MSKNRPDMVNGNDRNDFLKRIAASALLLMKGEKDGLTAGQAAARRREYGPNIIHEQLPSVWYIQLVRAFISPFNAVLLAVAMAWQGCPARYRTHYRHHAVCRQDTLFSFCRSAVADAPAG